MKLDELLPLCEELRQAINLLPTDKPAHLESSMGVVELCVVLNHLLDIPQDVLIWDVGHQTAAHKMLQGSWQAMQKGLRQWQGPSGFPAREEGQGDFFTTGHSATSLSALAGMAEAKKHKHYVAVIGDGALTGGMAMEALNYIGGKQLPCLIILNDNGKSIDENVGALHKTKRYKSLFHAFDMDFIEGGSAHDLPKIIDLLKQGLALKKPLVIRLTSEFGKGFTPREKTFSQKPHSFQKALEPVLNQALTENPNLYLVSPAMIAGAGWQGLKRNFPDRVIDAGIAEQHGVTLAAGLARAGKTVVVHLYSTFAQRAIDQMIHDVALQALPMFFIIDRAGLVGEDGPTHHGLFDIGLLRSIPHIEIFSPPHGASAEVILNNWLKNPKGIQAMRIPREVYLEDVGEIIGFPNKELLVLNFGSLYFELKKALQMLQNKDIEFDFQVVESLVLEQQRLEGYLQYKTIIVVEDSPGELGLYSQLSTVAFKNGFGCKILSISPPKAFIQHGSIPDLRHALGIDALGIFQKIQKAIL